jgi:hypothetical protein
MTKSSDPRIVEEEKVSCSLQSSAFDSSLNSQSGEGASASFVLE